MSPRAPAIAPSPPVTVHITVPQCQPGMGAAATWPRPRVENRICPRAPYVMVPVSTKVPSGSRCTSDSRTASSPSRTSTRAAMPAPPSTVQSAWLGATVRARRRPSAPGTGPAVPRNSRANEISPMTRSEDDHAAGQLAGGERTEGLVGLLQRVAMADELVDPQPSRLVERDQAGQVLADARAAIAAAPDHALTGHERSRIHRHGRTGGGHADEHAGTARRQRLGRLAHRAGVAHRDERVVGAAPRDAADGRHRVLARGVDAVGGAEAT